MASLDALNEKTAAEQASVGSEVPPPSTTEAPDNDQPDSRSSTPGTVNAEKEDRLGGSVPEKVTPKDQDAQDENVIVVDWDGPDDPENPRK